jgi:uncharacterized membrane protein
MWRDWPAEAIIVAMGLLAYLTRITGLLIGRRLLPTVRMQAVLDAVPTVLLMAMLAPMAFANGWASAGAAIVAAAAAIRFPVLLVVTAGMVSIVALRAVLHG